MAKIVKYKFLSAEINHGTEENPDIEQIFLDKEVKFDTKEQFDNALSYIKDEAYNGEYTVEGEFEETEPTAEERITELETQNAMLMECLLEMSEIVYA